MKRIRNGLVTAVLALCIALGGMASSDFMLNNVEKQAVKKETETSQEEIVLTEEETDHLALVLKALEKDQLIRKSSGSAANIPEEKAWEMMQIGISQLNCLMLYEYIPDFDLLLFGGFAHRTCELLTSESNTSVEMYRLTYAYYRDEDFSFEISGVMDARSGLLVSMDLTFMDGDAWEEKYGSEEQKIYDVYGNSLNELESYDKQYKNSKSLAWNEEPVTSKKLGEIYSLDFLVEGAVAYYPMNTNLEFKMNESQEWGKENYRFESWDGEYYLEFDRKDTNFRFQLHKFDL